MRFPAEYAELVRAHSGRSNPDESEFSYDGGGMQRAGNFGTLLSLSEDVAGSVFETAENFADRLPERVVPVIDTGSGDCVCLDYRHSASVKVVYFAHERSGERTIVPLADCFSDFVDKLQEPAAA